MRPRTRQGRGWTSASGTSRTQWTCRWSTTGRRVGEPGPVFVGPSGTGLGLAGMRERVAVFGGSLDVGRCAQGGFRVHARLPLEREQA